MILLLILDCGVFSDVFITHHLWFNFWQVICSFLKIKCTVYCEMGWLSLLRVTKPSSKLVLHMQVYLQPSVAWSGLGGLSGLEVGLGRPRAASRSASRSISMTSSGLEVGLQMTSAASEGNMGLFSKGIASWCEIWVYWSWAYFSFLYFSFWAYFSFLCFRIWVILLLPLLQNRGQGQFK